MQRAIRATLLNPPFEGLWLYGFSSQRILVHHYLFNRLCRMILPSEKRGLLGCEKVHLEKIPRVGARRMNILRLRGFFGGLTMSHILCKRDCSAESVNKGEEIMAGGCAKMENALALFPKCRVDLLALCQHHSCTEQSKSPLRREDRLARVVSCKPQ